MSVPHKPIHLPWWVQPLNVVVNRLNRAGVPVPGAQMLTVTGRKTGDSYDVAITPFSCEGQEYVIIGIPRATWTFNVRPQGPATIRHGASTSQVTLTEVTDEGEKRRVMRAYPKIQPLGVIPFRIMGHVSSSNPDEWEKAADLVELFRIDRG